MDDSGHFYKPLQVKIVPLLSMMPSELPPVCLYRIASAAYLAAAAYLADLHMMLCKCRLDRAGSVNGNSMRRCTSRSRLQQRALHL